MWVPSTNTMRQSTESGKLVTKVVTENVVQKVPKPSPTGYSPILSTGTIGCSSVAAAVAGGMGVCQAREFFDCDTLDGMELEDQGGDGTALAHWEQRIARCD